MELLEGVSGFAIYLGLKLGGYLLWSYVGVLWLGRNVRRPVPTALGLGVGRLLLGWLAGVMVAPFVIVAAGRQELPLFYFTGLALVRWFEWGVIQCFIPGCGSPAAFLTGGSSRARAWRLIGILVSYLADSPFLVTQGFPHGRLLC